MEFHEEQLKELKALFRDEGIDVTDDAVLEIARWLIRRAQSVARPLSPRERDALKRKEQEDL